MLVSAGVLVLVLRDVPVYLPIVVVVFISDLIRVYLFNLCSTFKDVISLFI